MFRVPNFEIVAFTDPVCTWCWGSEPILKKLEMRFPKKIKITYIMGGLVEDIRHFRDDINEIGGDDYAKVNKNIANHWLKAASIHQMPVDVDNLKIFSKDYPSTYPANIAYYAAKLQSEILANKFLRRMREAAAAESQQIFNEKVLIELAKEVGLKIGQFLESMNNGTAWAMFEEGLLFARANKITSFPSFLIRNNYNGQSIILRGYQEYNTFRDIITSFCEEKIKENIIETNEKNILGYLKNNLKITKIELQTIFDIDGNELDQVVNELENKGFITLEKFKHGTFIYYIGKPFVCDPNTGVCS